MINLFWLMTDHPWLAWSILSAAYVAILLVIGWWRRWSWFTLGGAVVGAIAASALAVFLLCAWAGPRPRIMPEDLDRAGRRGEII